MHQQWCHTFSCTFSDTTSTTTTQCMSRCGIFSTGIEPCLVNTFMPDSIVPNSSSAAEGRKKICSIVVKVHLYCQHNKFGSITFGVTLTCVRTHASLSTNFEVMALMLKMSKCALNDSMHQYKRH